MSATIKINIDETDFMDAFEGVVLVVVVVVVVVVVAVVEVVAESELDIAYLKVPC